MEKNEMNLVQWIAAPISGFFYGHTLKEYYFHKEERKTKKKKKESYFPGGCGVVSRFLRYFFIPLNIVGEQIKKYCKTRRA